MIAIIFDLDETLVDTTPAIEPLKHEDWQEAEKRISEFTLYDGIPRLLQFLKERRVAIAVVSTSPKEYCGLVLEHFGIHWHCIFGKEEGDKPNAGPMLSALEHLHVSPDQAIAFGDKKKDIEAAKRAGIASVGCLWGSNEPEELLKAEPDFVVDHPEEAIQLISKRFRL